MSGGDRFGGSTGWWWWILVKSDYVRFSDLGKEEGDVG